MRINKNYKKKPREKNNFSVACHFITFFKPKKDEIKLVITAIETE